MSLLEKLKFERVQARKAQQINYVTLLTAILNELDEAETERGQELSYFEINSRVLRHRRAIHNFIEAGYGSSLRENLRRLDSVISS